MATQLLNYPSSSLTYSYVKFSRSRKTTVSWPLVCLSLLCVIATVQAQTFQYSRGWTNGKRSGNTGAAAASPVGIVDLENGYLNPEAAELGIFPGHFPINLSPQARLRTLDYNQYLVRKYGMGSSGNLNTRKQPLWFGTIMGMDSADSASAPSQSASGSSSSSSAGSSNDF